MKAASDRKKSGEQKTVKPAVKIAPALLERRILILAPTGNDAALTANFLAQANLTSHICRDVTQLCAEIGMGCGTILLAEETLGQSSISVLIKTLAEQPSWSDIPIVLITSGGEVSQIRLRRLATFGPGGNVTLLERPFRPATLISAVEVALRGRQRQYDARALMENLSDARVRVEATLGVADVGTWTWDIQNDRVFADKNLARLFSVQEKDAAGGPIKKYLAAIHPEDRVRVEDVIGSALNSESGQYEIDYRIVQRDRSLRWVTARGKVERDANGRPARFPGVTIDITMRKQAEALLQQNGAMFSALVDLAPTGVFVVDSQFLIRQINPRALPLFAPVQPVIGHDFGEVMLTFWGTQLGAEVSKIFRHTLATGEPYKSPRFAEHRHDLNVDQAYEWEIQRVTLPDGSQGVVCYFNDITESERHKSNLAFLADISNDLLRLETVDAIMNTVGQKIGAYLKLASACFAEINEVADRVMVTHEWRRPEMPTLLGSHRLSDYLAADFQKVLRAGDCFIVRDTETDPRTDAGQYAALKLRSFICVPLVSDGRWKFLFDVHHSEPRDWRDDEIQLVREAIARLWARLERIRADSLLRQNEALFSALIEQAPVGVYVVDSQFRLQQVNARALPAFAKVDAHRGRDFAEVMHILWGLELGDQILAIFRHTLATGESYVSPRFSEFRQDLDEEKAYEWQTQRVTLPDGSHGVVCYFSDITENLLAEKNLVDAKTAAESASRAKDDFLAALSHELRTPLNPALLIASEAADNPELPEPVRQNFETIRKNIELEARLIDDLLDLTRITSGKLSLEKSPVDIHAVLIDAIGTIKSEQQTKEIQLDLRLDAKKFLVKGDSVRLQQVFWNVLKNAVKFTPKGGRITVETDNADGGLLLKISDTGIGMNATEVARVFNAFAQGDHAGSGGSHRFGGLGLGLAISKNLVELHAGKISATSAGSNQGSQFVIELPLTMETESDDAGAGKSSGKASAKVSAGNAPLSVLLVEDHEPTRTVLAQLLRRRNYQVLTASSIAEARAVARQNRFDLLISDIGLPDGNGNDLMNELREQYGWRGIALTGYGMEEDIARGKASGFVTHLIKPVRIESLETALNLVQKSV